jgi:CHAT domain-containing protein/Tfp pilus assembly protein PilF
MSGEAMNFLRFIFLLLIGFHTAYAAQQPRHDPSISATRDAIVKGEVSEALSALEAKALAAEQRANAGLFPQRNWAQASLAYREASGLARSTGQLQKAIAYGQKALEAAEKAGGPALQTRAISRLAFAYMQLGQDTKAKELWKKGIEVAKQIDIAQIQGAQMYRGLGNVQLRQGEIDEATRILSYALELCELGLAENLRRRANPRAILDVEEVRVGILNELGNAYRRAGKVDEAVEVFERGILVIKESGVKTAAEANLYLRLGQLHLGKKDYSKALENLSRALQMAEQFRYANAFYQAASSIGDLNLESDKPAEAISYYQRAIDSIESMRSLLQSEDFRSSFFEDKGQIYGGMILAHLTAKNFAAAFDYNERARSRAFLDILGSKVQLTKGGRLVEQERALQAKIGVLQAMTVAQGADSSPLRQELEEAQRDYNEFLAQVRKANKEQASLMNVEPLSLKQLQELLDPGVTVLEYFVLRGRAVLWVVEKDRVHFVRLTLNRRELISKVTALRESVFHVKEKEKFKQASEDLYRGLIAPALPHIRGKELLIIPHDVLHYLPFQALLSPRGKYLIQDYPIYYLSSASLMQFTKEKRRASGLGVKALILGNPDLGDRAYDLRFAEREAREIARVYPGGTVLLKEQATKSKALSLSPNSDMLHFAVHAEFNEQDPMSSALLLAKDGQDDGKLKVGEVFSLNLKADMVVLSACETGLGKISSGDEIIGLTRAFIYAGAPSVITTLWQVNDRASYELMREFYLNLKTMKKSEALRQAQLKTMKEFPEPFYWAAYGLTGEP